LLSAFFKRAREILTFRALKKTTESNLIPYNYKKKPAAKMAEVSLKKRLGEPLKLRMNSSA